MAMSTLLRSYGTVIMDRFEPAGGLEAVPTW